jgi:2-dehydro-3-deoxy-D-arabinonate dehydratase
MKLYRTRAGAVLERDGHHLLLGQTDWDTLINRDDLALHLRALAGATAPSPAAAALVAAELLSPVSTQEVWAAGVTYLRSRDARVAESKDAGGGDFYTRVYEAPRPEIFFKATPHRVAPPGGALRIRRDSSWDVPEPEFTLYITSSGRIVGYTCGNDLSSRSIEGENPLYLPQAKTWDLCASVGPCLYVPDSPLPSDTTIALEILRGGESVFQGETCLSQMKRGFEELAGWLTAECTFPGGVFLMTGTCIVPPDSFTLRPGDEVRITIPPIGTLVNVIRA